jgi:Na+/proline symporter
MPSTSETLQANVGVQGISLPRFAWLLALGALGLAGLLTLGVGGMALVSGHVFPAATANVARGPGLTGR